MLIFLGIVVSSTVGIIYFRVALDGTNEPGTTVWDNYTEIGIYTALEEIEIGDINYSLETYMWRDFMPISPPDGKPLIAIIKIHVSDILVFPSELSLERIWLINDINIISALHTTEYKISGNIFEMVFRNGPKWGPGIAIDVVVKLRDINQNIYYLKAVNQPIYRTD